MSGWFIVSHKLEKWHLQKTKDELKRSLHHVLAINLLLQIFSSLQCYGAAEEYEGENFIIHSNMIIRECARVKFIRVYVWQHHKINSLSCCPNFSRSSSVVIQFLILPCRMHLSQNSLPSSNLISMKIIKNSI